MSDIKHTEGPWRFDVIGPKDNYVVEVSNGCEQVATATTIEDARLIAEVPAMLELLRMAAYELEDIHELVNGTTNTHPMLPKIQVFLKKMENENG